MVKDDLDKRIAELKKEYPTICEDYPGLCGDYDDISEPDISKYENMSEEELDKIIKKMVKEDFEIGKKLGLIK